MHYIDLEYAYKLANEMRWRKWPETRPEELEPIVVAGPNWIEYGYCYEEAKAAELADAVKWFPLRALAMCPDDSAQT